MNKIDKYIGNDPLDEARVDVMMLLQNIQLNTIKLENLFKSHNLNSLVKNTKNIKKQLDMIKTRFKREEKPEM